MMHIGMLWMDDSARPLHEKIHRAAAYYHDKYGETPTECYVHPSMLPEGNTEIEGIAVQPLDDILPQHLWLGVGDAEVRQAAFTQPSPLAPASSHRAPAKP